ncbi:TetR/AcrR family transcriptional regulator [Streptomyces ovatisporus]|uniref:TetR/AcrR family transcriptional regulator n=1 Tax=Streptomyces ovatisporus TaxID=1128682 RepID=A0ABV9A0D8_9ACTN
MRTVDPARFRARRRHIVDAAAALFAAKGFERTTTAEICRAAGMSSGNLFHYFRNKRAIFHAVFEEDGEEKARRLEEARSRDDPWEGLLEIVDLLAVPATEPLAPPLVMEAMVQAYRDSELEELLSRDSAAEHAAIASVLRKASAAGRTDPGLDPDHAASWVMALIASLYTSAATDPSFTPSEQLPMLRLILRRFLLDGREHRK